jgi:hypothetical protein
MKTLDEKPFTWMYPHFIQNYGFVKKKKSKIKMLASLDWCQTCALGSEIWEKNEK